MPLLHCFFANSPFQAFSMRERPGLALCCRHQSLNNGARMNLFKSAVSCVVVLVLICWGELFAETPPASTMVKPVELRASANSIGMKFQLIPAGTFVMGKGDKAHRVTISQPFQFGIHEVTQKQYLEVMGLNPSRFKGIDNPVEMVAWGDAVEFCKKLSGLPKEKAAGNVYRLPTEAEWSYACHAATTTLFSFGDSSGALKEYSWYGQNSERRSHPVGQKRPNPWGLYDMHGNLCEWCQDRFESDPAQSSTAGTGRSSDLKRVLRGGSMLSTVERCRSASRGFAAPASRAPNRGFRVVLLQTTKAGSRGNEVAKSHVKWQAYKPKDQAFMVEFPRKPEPWKTKFVSPDYGPTDVYHVSAEFEKTMFGVNFNDYPRNLTEAEVNAELKQAYTLPGTGAKILATTDIKMAGGSSIEVISKTGPIYIVGRFFVTDARRLYSLQVGSLRDPRKDRVRIDRFFDSFQLAESSKDDAVGGAK